MDKHHSPKSLAGSAMNHQWIAIRVSTALGVSFLRQCPDQQRVILTDWVRALEDYPRPMVEMAFEEWIETQEFPPKPANIRSIVLRRISDKVTAGDDSRHTPRRLDDCRSWLAKHSTIGSHMVGWSPYVVETLLREGHNAKRLWDAGFRTDRLRDLAGVSLHPGSAS